MTEKCSELTEKCSECFIFPSFLELSDEESPILKAEMSHYVRYDAPLCHPEHFSSVTPKQKAEGFLIEEVKGPSSRLY